MALAREVLSLRRHVAMLAAPAVDQQHRRRAAHGAFDAQRDAVAVQEGHARFSFSEGDERTRHSTFLCAATAAALHIERMSRNTQVSASSGIR